MEEDRDSRKRLVIWVCICLGVILTIAILSWGTMKHEIGRAVRRKHIHKFGATYMTMNNPFYEIIDDEIRSILESRGDMLITRDPALDVLKQIEQVEEMIEQGVEGIFINPVDWK